MCNLFIIGNGFDRDHDMATSYADFRKYLENTYKIKAGSLEQPSLVMTLDHHGYDYDESAVASFLLNLLDASSMDEEKEWRDFEGAMGGFCDIFEEWHLSDLEVTDSEGDVDFIKTERNKTDVCSDLFTATQLGSLFSAWISTCPLPLVQKPKFADLLTPGKDIFLSFNYTETLETLYSVKDVCHIHGKRGSDLIVGHGESERKLIRDDETGYVDATEEALFDMHEKLRKNTRQILKTHRFFFESLPAVKNIYSYGFSYSDVDMVYIAEICKNISRDSIWHFNDYDSDRHPEYCDKILKHGFKGKFSGFNVD